MGDERPIRKVKRPVQGGPPLGAGRPTGGLLVVAEVGDRFQADLAVSLAESEGYRLLVQPIIGYAVWGTDSSRAGYSISAHEDDVDAVRRLFAAHGIDVVRPTGLQWRGPAIATALVLGIALVVVLLNVLG